MNNYTSGVGLSSGANRDGQRANAEFRHRTEQNLAEITDKLNGLIGYVAGQRPDGGINQ